MAAVGALRIEAWLRYLALFGFVSLSAYSAAQIFWSFTPMPEQELAAIDFRAAQNNKAQVKMASPSLFGFLEVVEKKVVEPTKKTKLKLTLKGVMPAVEMKDSMAIISSRSKKDEVYRIDAQIIRGVLLKEVYSDHVILERAGKSESLYFDEDKLLTLIENSDEQALVQQKPVPSNTRKSVGSDVGTLSPAEILDTYEALFEEDPNALLASTGLRSNGTSYEVLASSSLIAMGLKAGDKIVAVNGQSVGNIESDAGLGELVRKQSVANFQIQRGSRTFSVSYPIK
jgi:general secretion pathway protein C